MKNTVLLSIATLLILSLTSCWEFNRRQRFKNAENKGKADLIEATSSKQIQIEDAKGLAEASELKAKSMINIAKAEAQAEIERAKGVAEANRIIGNSLEGNTQYLKYLQIQAIIGAKGDKVYIPTEAGLPILEARK